MKSAYEIVSPLGTENSSRTPIIFLHGLFFSKKSWRYVAPVICKKTRRKGYLLDARNHGDSPWSNEMNFDALTEDLLEFMNDLGIRKAILVGHSAGGRTVMNMALKHPHRVEALVVEEMTPKNVKSGNKTIVRILFDVYKEFLKNSTVTDEDPVEARKQLFEMGLSFVHPTFVDKEKMLKNVDLDVLPIILEGNKVRSEFNDDAIQVMLNSNPLCQDLPQKNLVYNGDALFIYGTKGFFKLDRDPTIKPLFPRAVIKRVEGGSHAIHLECPEEYFEIVLDFLLQRDMQPSKY